MSFNSETAKAAGEKSKRGPAKELDPNIKEKMEILYEGVLDHLIMHQDELSMSDRVKLLQSLSNYLLPKTKSVRDVLSYVFKRLNLNHYKNYIRINKRYIRPNELHHLKGDPKKAKKILRWKHEYTFETMLDEMIIDIKNRFYPDQEL